MSSIKPINCVTVVDTLTLTVAASCVSLSIRHPVTFILFRWRREKKQFRKRERNVSIVMWASKKQSIVKCIPHKVNSLSTVECALLLERKKKEGPASGDVCVPPSLSQEEGNEREREKNRTPEAIATNYKRVSSELLSDKRERKSWSSRNELRHPLCDTVSWDKCMRKRKARQRRRRRRCSGWERGCWLAGHQEVRRQAKEKEKRDDSVHQGVKCVWLHSASLSSSSSQPAHLESVTSNQEVLLLLHAHKWDGRENEISLHTRTSIKLL